MYFDRVHNVRINAIPEGEVLLGRYMLIEENNKTRYLVPDKEGNCKTVNGRIKIKSEILENLSPENLAEIVAPLSEPKDFSTISNISPLIRGVNNEVELTKFEKELGDKLHHLKNICRTPHLKLSVQHLKMPISRAKRIPKKAIAVLAANSQDWARRKLRSVIPNRILTTLHDETLDIYENRLVATLLEMLVQYLNERIKTIEKLAEYLGVVEKILEKLSIEGKKTWRKKIARNYKLIAGLCDNSGLRSTAENNLHQLIKLRKQIMQLFNSLLYITCRNHKIKGEPIRTNLLVNDRHYRVARKLYEDLTMQIGVVKSPEEFEIKTIETVQNFSKFAFILLIRALKSLEYNTTQKIEIKTGTTYQFSHPHFDLIALECAANDTFKLSIADKTINLIPLAGNWVAKTAAAQDFNDNTFILFNKNLPFLKKDSENYDWLSIVPSEQNKALIPIALENIDSVERLTRMIRYYALGNYLRKFPFELKVNARINLVKKLEGINQIQKKNKNFFLLNELNQVELTRVKDKVSSTIFKEISDKNEAFKKWKNALKAKRFEPDFSHHTFRMLVEETFYGLRNDKKKTAYIKIPKMQEIIAAADANEKQNPLIYDNLFGQDIICDFWD